MTPLNRLSEVERFLKYKQDKLVHTLKYLEHRALKEIYNFDEAKALTKPLDDLIKEHYLLLGLLFKNKDWIKYAAFISEESYRVIKVPGPIEHDWKYANSQFTKYYEITTTKYTGKDISTRLKSFLKDLEPFLKTT
jgi:hypothetical protein